MGKFGAIWIATVILFIVSPLAAPGSTNTTALLSMIPFAAILALASIGQMFVMQQGGLDLSAPGVISLSAVLVTQIPQGRSDDLFRALVVVLAASLVIGLFNGVIVAILKVTPLVATLGTNALIYGFIYQYTGGNLAAEATPNLTSFASERFFGIPNTAVIAIVTVVFFAFALRNTTFGRRFELVGASAPAARVAGLHVLRYQIGTYVAAAVGYSVAGVLLAGYVTTPSMTMGDSYLLPTIVAVVLGGTVLGAGTASVVATAMGALFLQQLDQLVLTLGATSATQDLLQAVILAVGMGLRAVHWRGLRIDRWRRKDTPEPFRVLNGMTPSGGSS